MTSFVYDRYKTDIAEIFSEEKKLNYQLRIEKELAFANFQVGKIPKEAYDEIAHYCNESFVKLERVKEIEKDTHHDLMSVVLAIAEKCPKFGGYVHLGATSNDIQDTVLGLQLKKAKKILIKQIDEISIELKRLAVTYQDLVCIGRTHGQHAIPITYGFKFANFLSEIELNKSNLKDSKVDYGKFSGAVGNYASYGTQEIENIVLERLFLEKLPITTQVIPRIIHSKFIFSLGSIASTLERISKEIRNLQRTEIGEVLESFGKKQVGSSTMPHKRNPHKSERICGLAKVVRGFVGIELENISLEHERDLTNSSSERVVIPESINLLSFMLNDMLKVLKTLKVNKDVVDKNLLLTQGRVCAERLMISLTDKIGRQKAHELLNKLTDAEGDYITAVKNSEINKHLSDSEIESLLNPRTYIGLSKVIVDQVLEYFYKESPKTYADAGVDINKENIDIEAIGKWVTKSFDLGKNKVSTSFGHYANTIPIDDYELGLATDGVGSKLLIAEKMEKFDTIGIDCVAMNTNDLLCLGLKPIAFVDYLATDKALGLEKADAIAKGLYEGCKLSKMPLLGGEMATLPDIVKNFDLAGTALGIARKGTLIDGSTIKSKDLVIGIPSSGIHSNGFTLARKVLLPRYKLDEKLPNGRTLGEELLIPTKIYYNEVMALLEANIPIKGIAHITGSGFRKIMRLTNKSINIDFLPELPTIFSEIKTIGNVSWEEMFSTFNMGIGMVIIISSEERMKTLEILSKFTKAWELGNIGYEENKISINPYNIVLKRKN